MQYLILYRNRSGRGRLWPDIRSEGDFHLHESFVIVKKYQLNDDGSLLEATL